MAAAEKEGGAGMSSGSPSTEPVFFRSFLLGEWMTNAYLAGDPETRAAWVVDPGFSPEPLLDFIKEEGWQVSRILFTHAHLDHIAGAGAVRKLFPESLLCIHKSEAAFLTDPSLNLSALMGMNIVAPPADRLLEEGDLLQEGALSCRVIHTPGHSPGGLCFYFEKENRLVSGDTLFQGSVGRYDFPTSDGEALFSSIREKLLPLPDVTSVFPGHGPDTVLGREKQTNPYLI